MCACFASSVPPWLQVPALALRPAAETVPFRTIAFFTAFQLTYLLLVYALTWAGVAG